MHDRRPLHPVHRGHLGALAGRHGIMQHAIGSIADPAHGSCTDDVARALQLDLLHGRTLGWSAVADGVGRGLRYLEDAFDPGTGTFRDFRRTDGTWIDAAGSEDCQGRAVHALGDVIATARGPVLPDLADRLLTRALPAAERLGAIRAVSSVVLGCDAAVRGGSRGRAAEVLTTLGDRLLAAFTPVLESAWPWPDSRLTYENALPARALIVAGRHRSSPRHTAAGIRVLDWLIDIQAAPDGHLSPVGNAWWSKVGPRPRFDQQPIEATALLLAAEAALAATGDRRYVETMERAYAWFLGDNDLGIPVVDTDRGAGYDGLTPVGVNSNQGAESTLMWLIALEHVRAQRAGRPVGAGLRAQFAMATPA
jgi:hypothetical protein